MTGPRPVGHLAWLVDASDAAAARALHAVLTSAPLPGQVSARPGATTVLVTFRDRASASAAARALAGLRPPDAPPRPAGRDVVIDVVYDGPDLDAVAEALDVSRQQVVAEHTAARWTVAFCGFAPGFAYLDGWRRHVPRHASPRTRVPAGAVGVADTWSAVYPSPSPGGWQLLGRTDAPLWSTDRTPPALLAPGDAVRFRAVRATASAARAGATATVLPATGAGGPGSVPTAEVVAEAAATAGDAGGGEACAVPGPGLLVVEPGPLTLVEDLGRGGAEHLGVPPSGAADRAAAGDANRLVGNPREAALLETTGGLRLSATARLVVAVHGAPGPLEVESSGRAARRSHGAPFELLPGDVLHVAAPAAGVRRYVAVRGGIEGPRALGSRSSDLLSGLGPAPLRAGQVLPVGRRRGVVGLPATVAEPADVVPLGVVLGPRDDWFDAAAVRELLGAAWTVGPDSNRVGVRLAGPPLARAVDGELRSEPMVAGAVQVPPSGAPVVLLRDHPTTGGYPVIAVVTGGDLDRLAQVAPGDRVRFALA